MHDPAPDPARGYTAEQVRAAEAPLLAAGAPLMRRAAAALAAEVRALLVARRSGGASRSGGKSGGGARVLVLAGSGDNGGDALWAAAELAAEGAVVSVLATGARIHEAGAAAARRAGCRWVSLDDGFDAAIGRAEVIVDGILDIGSGASPALRGDAREAVRRILGRDDVTAETAGARPLVVAVDLPSGIGSDDGAVPDPSVLRADVTVTFGAVKAGLLLPPGADHAGRVVLVDLGLGPALEGVRPAVSST